MGRFGRLQNWTRWMGTVRFLNRWPQTKRWVTLDTCFRYSFYVLSHGSLGFASIVHFIIAYFKNYPWMLKNFDKLES